MYAYEGAFNDAEVQEWLDKQLSRYEKFGFGLWAVILKETDDILLKYWMPGKSVP